MPHDCPECDGTGVLVAWPDRFSRVYAECPVCGGSGVIDTDDDDDPDEEENQE